MSKSSRHTEAEVGQPKLDEFDEEHELALIEHQQGRLLDKYGHEYSEGVFINWTPAAIKALGIRRVVDDGGEQ